MNLIDFLPKDWFLHHQVAMCIAKYRKLLLAYSGGLDSTVLLDILTTLRNINNNHNYLMVFPLSLRVVHIHHGMHQHADKWVNHCNQQCKMRNISFQVVYIKNFFKKNDKKCNIEASARFFRYQKLYDLLNLGEILLTAHHMDDQVETFLLALKRGSGPTGLSGMSIDAFYYHKYRILRPLLKCSRLQLKKYAISNNLDWVEDDTNKNIVFDRNFLRIKVLPCLYKRWPSFNKVVTRTAELCRKQEYLLNELLLNFLNPLIDADGALFFEPLLQYSALKGQALLRLWIAGFSVKMPPYQFIYRLWTEVILSRNDAAPILRLDQNLCRRFRGKLYFIPVSITLPVDTTILNWVDSCNTMLLPCNLGLLIFYPLIFSNNFLQKKKLMANTKITCISNIFFNFFKKHGKILTICIVRAPRFNEKISVRFGHVDGLLYILNRNRGRKLKKIWQELAIPPWLRDRIPLLFYNHILIAAIGVFITRAGKIDTGSNADISRQIFWVQETLYHKFFKSSICDYLK